MMLVLALVDAVLPAEVDAAAAGGGDAGGAIVEQESTLDHNFQNPRKDAPEDAEQDAAAHDGQAVAPPPEQSPAQEDVAAAARPGESDLPASEESENVTGSGAAAVVSHPTRASPKESHPTRSTPRTVFTTQLNNTLPMCGAFALPEILTIFGAAVGSGANSCQKTETRQVRVGGFQQSRSLGRK